MPLSIPRPQDTTHTVQSQQSGGQNVRYYSNVRHEMVPFMPALYSRVLEVGCGEGASVPLLPAATEVWGVEMMPDAAARAAEVMHTVLVGTYDAVRAGLPQHYFDLVVCNDVIEHLPDPDAFLRSVREHMVPGGYILASIPNMRHWEVLAELLVRRDWRYRADGVMDRTHLKFFTERSIRRLFEDAGFVVVRQSGINGTFHPLRRLLIRSIGLLTLGTYRDIEYRQFGVLASLT